MTHRRRRKAPPCATLTSLAACAAALLGAAAPRPAHAANLLPGFVESLVTGGLSNATAMEFAPDNRLFVAQQTGELRVVRNGTLLSTPFVSLAVDSSGERGLLGVAFDPNFTTTSPFVYVYHTVPGVAGQSAPHNRVTRFTVDPNSPDVALAGSGVPLLDLEPLGPTNHNGGAIHFGPDGKLYVAVGDNAAPANAQSLANRLGKILRINPDGTIPLDNPTAFAGVAGTPTGDNRAIWALGLRNPFTFAFQPGTDVMHLNDVGQNSSEEVNVGAAGANYGWNATEGDFNQGAFPNFTRPLLAYPHFGSPLNGLVGFSIAGAAFYNPLTPTFPSDYGGDYFFGDFVSGWIARRDDLTGEASLFATGIANPVDLKVGSDGGLYYLARGSGEVFRIQAVAQAAAPEPGTLALLGVGLVGVRALGLPRRRRR